MSYVERSVARNALVVLGVQVLPVVAALLTLPVLTSRLGAERVGLLSLVWTVVGYLTLLDLGIGVAVTKSASEMLSRGQPERVREIFWSGLAVQGVMGGLGGALLLIGTPALVVTVLRVPPGLYREASVSLHLCAIALPFVLVSSSAVGVLQGAQRFDLAAAIQAPIGIAQYVGPLICALAGTNLIPIVVCIVGLRGVSVVLLAIQSNRALPGLLRKPNVSAQRCSLLLRFGSWITVSSIVSPLLVYGDRFVVGHIFGLAAVAYYAVPGDAAMRCLILPASLVAALFPALTSLGAQQKSAETLRLLNRSFRAVLCFVGIPVLFVIIRAHDIIAVWLGTAFADRSASTLQILLLGILANALARIPQSLLIAHGRADVPAKLQLLALPLQAVLLFALTSRYGISGAAAAWSARLLLEAVALVWAAGRLYPLTQYCLRAGHWRPLIAVCTTGVVIGAICTSVIREPLVRTALTGAAFTALLPVAASFSADFGFRHCRQLLLRSK
jgi:O-antigen/teichoic acid export membrane protein